MPQQLSREVLNKILQSESIDGLSVPQIVEQFLAEEQLARFLPDGVCQMDPRDGALIIYNSTRARRPHDYAPPLPGEAENKACPVCEGNTTGVIDVANLSEGFTFINKNLFPILYPLNRVDAKHLQAIEYDDPSPDRRTPYGLHFLQWTSSLHDNDWQNLPLNDRVTVLERLAALEAKLLFGSGSEEVMPPSAVLDDGKKSYGFVSIIKNYGLLVGGSLSHGHQQIAFCNVMPRRFYHNWRFLTERGELFSNFMLRENSDDLLIRDYGPAVLLVPYFMKRPYNMLLIIKDMAKKYLCELTPLEIEAVAEGWHDAIRAILEIMPRIGKETAYNVTTHNGPGAGLYFEFLPYTQETGGFEHLGLWVCQNNPHSAASGLRKILRYVED